MNQSPNGADTPLDDADREALDSIRDLYTALDPPPDDLVARIQFAVELHDVDIEVLRLTADQEALALMRGEEHRTITFDSDTMSIMIRVSPAGYDRVRVDGWIAPPLGYSVELRTRSSSLTTDADDQGRFAFAELPHGLIQLVVHHHVDGTDARPASRRVVTPSIVV